MSQHRLLKKNFKFNFILLSRSKEVNILKILISHIEEIGLKS